MDLRSGCLECKLELNAALDILHSYWRKISWFSVKVGCILRFCGIAGWRLGAVEMVTSLRDQWRHLELLSVLSSLHCVCVRSLNLVVIRVSSSPRASSPSSLSPSVSPALPLLFIPISRRQTAHKGCTVSRCFFRIEIRSVENGNAMIDWAQLAQRSSERHRLYAVMMERNY